jgi:hypothetical protein
MNGVGVAIFRRRIAAGKNYGPDPGFNGLGCSRPSGRRAPAEVPETYFAATGFAAAGATTAGLADAGAAAAISRRDIATSPSVTCTMRS